jgi:hypothetical protein
MSTEKSDFLEKLKNLKTFNNDEFNAHASSIADCFIFDATAVWPLFSCCSLSQG